MDNTQYLQDALQRLNRMSEGSATEIDYIHYAKVYRLLQRRGYRIPDEWPQPQNYFKSKEKNST